MSRGDRPLPLEQLEPYMRGAKFAALALGRRHNEHDPDIAAMPQATSRWPSVTAKRR
jgi:hypothetical protein